jgi:hypothetical protein
MKKSIFKRIREQQGKVHVGATCMCLGLTKGQYTCLLTVISLCQDQKTWWNTGIQSRLETKVLFVVNTKDKSPFHQLCNGGCMVGEPSPHGRLHSECNYPL